MQEINTVICPYCAEDNNIKNKTCYECNSSLLLNNKYHLLEVLGENIGITYVGVVGLSPSAYPNPPLSYAVIKELAIKKVDRWKTEELFKREGSILKSLEHKSIPKFIEQFNLEINKNISYFLVMEHIEGVTIEEELETKIYNEEEVFAFIKEIASTLSYLQSFRPPIIHRDIKPSNLIRKYDGSIAIIDFGGVKDAIKPNAGSTVAATFGYAAPEQILGRAVIQSDFYSLGITALKLLTKKDINDLASNLDLNTESYHFLSDKMAVLIDKLIANNVKDRFNTSKEIINFIDKEETIKIRNLEEKSTKNLGESQTDTFYYYFDKLKEEWGNTKINNNLQHSWIFVPISAILLVAYNDINSLIAGGVISFILLLFLLEPSFKERLKDFLNKIFKDKDLKDLEPEIIYTFIQYLDAYYSEGKFISLSTIYRIFKNKILEENKKDKKKFKNIINKNKSFLDEKIILDETKLALYRLLIKNRRYDE